MPIKERRQGGRIFCLYSIPGAGKTLMAGALMRLLYEQTGKKALYCDWENGECAIPEELDCCFDLWQPDPMRDPIDEAESVRLLAEDGDYSVVVTDTISSLGDALLYSVTLKNLSDEKETKRPTVRTDGGHELRRPTQSDYGTGQMHFQQWAQGFYAVQMRGTHILWLAHERVVEVKEANGALKEAVGGPEVIGGKLTKTVPKVPHLVGRIKIVQQPGKGPARIIQTEVDGLYISKDRLRVHDPRGVDITATGKSGADLTRNILDKGIGFWRPLLNAQGAQEGK